MQAQAIKGSRPISSFWTLNLRTELADYFLSAFSTRELVTRSARCREARTRMGWLGLPALCQASKRLHAAKAHDAYNFQCVGASNLHLWKTWG